MAYEVQNFTGLWGIATSKSDNSAKQYYAVELTAADQVDVCNGTGDLVVGILQNKPKAGESALVMSAGISKAVAGGTVTFGNRVGTDGNGKLVAKTSDADLVCGIALNGAGSGEVFSVLLTIGAQRAA
jgi:hypothetical protein